MHKLAILTIALVLCLFGSGCESKWREILRDPEVPAANLPQRLRQENWRSPSGDGSCVIASSCSALQWVKQPKLAEEFRRRYSGGQTAQSIRTIWQNHSIPFEATERREDFGNPEFLEWVSKTRRMAIIWYFPSHCVSFCGFGKLNGREVAWLLDNNRTQRFIPIEKSQFLSEWRGYGGFAMAPKAPLTPAPSLPFPGYEVQ